MAMKFEYDDKGTTFYYFVLSFFAMVLIPLTYFFWPDDEKSQDKSKKEQKPCYCHACMEKKELLKKSEPKKKTVKHLTRATLVVLWALLIAGVVKVSQFEKEYSEYDPYDILQIDRGASVTEIRKAYRKLSLMYHPDKYKGPDSHMFMKIAKAYEALTDEESRKNWEEFGNPDGPQATTFGIALPSWIIDKKNSMWVLAVYGMAFMVILPVAVGTWWYRSIQYSADEVLMDTERIYYSFLVRQPNMAIKRVLMLLAASLEFEKHYNNEVQERPSDNVELPQLMKDLPHLNEKNREVPLCYPYSIKARALLQAHLSRLDLPPDTLRKDLELILKKCPYLIREMINIVNQLVYLAQTGRGPHPPTLLTLENLIKLSGMVVQASWESKSSFLMLPHITQDHLRHFSTKKRHIKTLRQFVGMKNEDRRLLLRTLSDEQYQDVINVCCSYPVVEMEIEAKVLDDKDSHIITAGSLVTVKAMLMRKSLEDFLEDDTQGCPDLKEEDEDKDGKDSPKPGAKVWQKNKKKPKKSKPAKQQPKKKNTKLTNKKKPSTEAEEDDKKKEKTPEKTKDKKGDKKSKTDKEDVDSGTAELNDDSDEEERESGDEEDEGDDGSDNKDSDSDQEPKGGIDDEEWDSLQADIEKPEAVLETKSKETHIVHCPYFPMEKHEYWWAYIVSRRTSSLVTPVQFVTSLKESEEVSFKFGVPDKPGIYNYQFVVRSDSYVDFDVYQNFKIEVSEAREVDPGAQWDFSSEDEEKGDDESGESVYETDEDSD